MLTAAFTSAWQAKPQAVHTNRAWLSRDFASTCPHAEHRWLVNAGLTFSTRPGAFSSSRRTSSPHPDRKIPRFSPALARTLRPGSSRVPFADWVIFLIRRSSTRIRSNRRAMSVDAFSAQSLRRSVSRASQPRDGQPHPACGGPSPAGRGQTCAPAAAAWPAQARSGPGTCSSSPVDRAAADRDAPVDADHLPVTGRGNRRRDGGERDMPAACPIHRDAVRLHARRNGAGPAEPNPSRLRHPDLPGVTGEPPHLPRFAGAPTTRNPSSRPALRQDGRPAGLVGSKNAAIAWAKSRSACCWTI